MIYAVCILNNLTQRVDVLDYGQRVEHDALCYVGQDYHVIPLRGHEFLLGVHELNRECACRTKVLSEYSRPIVVHNEKVN